LSQFDLDNSDDFGADYGEAGVTAEEAYNLGLQAASQLLANQAPHDAHEVAATAAQLLRQAQQEQATQIAAQNDLTAIERSMAAAYKEDWAKHSNDTFRALTLDEEFAKRAATGDLNATLQRVDQVFNGIKEARDPAKAEWELIRQSGDNDYAMIRARQDAIRDVQGG
jgi:hypothetical protein